MVVFFGEKSLRVNRIDTLVLLWVERKSENVCLFLSFYLSAVFNLICFFLPFPTPLGPTIISFNF